MTVNLSALAGAGQQFFDNIGNPLSGGKLYSYEAGTTTPQPTYTTAAGNIAHTNPIILNSAGRVATGEIWLTAGQNYKFVLTTSTDVTIATWDNITGINGTGIASNAVNVQYDPAGFGAVSTTVQAKLRETVSVLDFGADPTGVENSTAAVQAALATMFSTGGTLYFPKGTYLTDFIDLRGYFNITLLGENETAEFAFRPGTEIKIRSACTVGIRIVNPTDTSQVGPPVGAGAYIAIKNIYLNANNLATTGINMYKAVSMENCAVRYAVQDGIVFEAYTYPVSLRSVIVAYSGRHGLHVKAPGTTVYTLENCEFAINGGDGVYAAAGNNCVFNSVLCQSNTGNGFYFYNPDPATYADSGQLFLDKNTFINCYAEANTAGSFVTRSYNENPATFTGKMTDFTFINGSFLTPSLRGCSTVVSIGAIGNISVDPAFNTVGLDFFPVWGSLNLKGGKIEFPAVQIPSTDVNTLDDYKEGTFTPVVVGSTAAGTATYSLALGTYTKVGRLVHFTLSLSWSAHTGTGDMTITGLPFAQNANVNQTVFTVQSANLGIPVGAYGVIARLAQSSSTILLFGDGIAATSSTPVIPMDTAATLFISGSYQAS